MKSDLCIVYLQVFVFQSHDRSFQETQFYEIKLSIIIRDFQLPQLVFEIPSYIWHLFSHIGYSWEIVDVHDDSQPQELLLFLSMLCYVLALDWYCDDYQFDVY